MHHVVRVKNAAIRIAEHQVKVPFGHDSLFFFSSCTRIEDRSTFSWHFSFWVTAVAWMCRNTIF